MFEFKVYLEKKLIQKTVVSKERVTIGRSSENDLVLSNPHVSRVHIIIRKDQNELLVENKSMNGILIDGKNITGTSPLASKSLLQVFPYEIECSLLTPSDDGTLPISKEEVSKAADKTGQASGEKSFNGTIPYHFGMFVGESPVLQKVYQLIEDVAVSNATALIRGEHGTGKELVALAIHQTSQRSEKPFIAVNCAAIPVDLIESELFGHEKGAFTGAHSAQKGKIEEANGGTLFLDEIGELSLTAQAKLLRFLQGKVIMRVGSAREFPVDVRIVAATNKDLEQAVRDGSFRPDLYYRIKVVQISLPALKSHPEDIPLLAEHFIQKFRQELQLASKPVLTDSAMKKLLSYRWPGNIRQFENLLYSSIICSKPPYILDESSIQADTPTWNSGTTEEEAPIDSLNKQHLMKVLKENQWDTVKTAQALKVSRGTIYYKMKKYGIVTPDLKTFS
jgi:transcriptional regulator with PAS, ATPase and Fis domain